MQKTIQLFAALVCFHLGVGASCLLAGHGVLLQGKGRLVILDESRRDGLGEEVGTHPRLPRLAEWKTYLSWRVALASRKLTVNPSKLVWRYDSAKQGGPTDKPVEVHACQWLDNGNIMIAETTRQRIIEVDRDGVISKDDSVESGTPTSAHRYATGPEDSFR